MINYNNGFHRVSIHAGMTKRFAHFLARLPEIIILLVVLPVLSACQQGLPEATATPSEAATRTPAPTHSPVPATVSTITPSEAAPISQINLLPEDLRGTIIHFWHPWTGAAGQLMHSLVDEFNLTNEWGIVVVPVAQAGLDGIDDQLALARFTGETPDLVVGYMHQLLEWDQAQPLTDLQAYVNDPVWGLSTQEQADFTPAFWEQDFIEGRRLGVPLQRSAQVLYYNTSWAQALGFSVPPVTPDMFRQQVCEAAWVNRSDAELENDGTGGWIVSTNYAAALSWIYAFGGDVVAPPGPGQEVYQFNTPPMDRAFAFLRGLYDESCAWLSESAYPEAEFADRLGLVSTGSVMDIPYQAQAFRQAGNTDQWRVIAYPTTENASAINAYGASLAILPSSPEEQLAAWQLIRWLLDPVNHARFVEASGSFPIRESELAHLEDYRKRYPQWDQALELIPGARPEPTVSSWGQVRLALSDAFTQLFRSYFSIDQIPTLLDYLDRTAADLHVGPERSGVFDTPTPTPSPTATPTRTPVPSPTIPPTRTPNAAPAATWSP
jgi:multiple sugar transport system substrate-binding protein/sn-glycerol 3-phosphate transport system substrate-binding protein